MAAENPPMLRGITPALNLPEPRGQRVSMAQRIMNQEMALAQGKRR
jgi:hypothetical protein